MEERDMSGSGLSESRLARMRDVMGGYVERGELPGLVLAVSRRGEALIEPIGAADPDGTPIRDDTIFRLGIRRYSPHPHYPCGRARRAVPGRRPDYPGFGMWRDCLSTR
jgi:hypothetical protein